MPPFITLSFADNMTFAFSAFLAVVVVVIQAAPVVVEEEPWNAEVNFGPEENFRGKSRRSTAGNHLRLVNHVPLFIHDWMKLNSFNAG